MDEVKPRRGRPPRTKAVEELPKEVEIQAEPVTQKEDLVVRDSAAQTRLRHAKATFKSKTKLKYTGEKYYYIQPYLNPNGKSDGKLILCRMKTNKCLYRTYIGRESKLKAFIKKIRSEDLLRDNNGVKIN